jgi:hypothetical protein
MGDKDPLSTMKGAIYGLVFALIFWAFIAMIVYGLLA